MMLREVLFVTLLAALTQAEPPVFNNGYNYPNPSQQYQQPQSYQPPAPSSGYGAPSAGGYSDGYDTHNAYDDGHHGHDNHEPKSYEFGYSVKDAYSGNDYDRQEKSDGNTVTGEYRVQLPDGRTQIVTYHADWRTGFHADVRYEGQAKYPEPAPYKAAYGPPAQDSYNYNAQPAADYHNGYNNQQPSGGGYDSYNSYSTPKPQYGTPSFH